MSNSNEPSLEITFDLRSKHRFLKDAVLFDGAENSSGPLHLNQTRAPVIAMFILLLLVKLKKRPTYDVTYFFKAKTDKTWMSSLANCGTLDAILDHDFRGVRFVRARRDYFASEDGAWQGPKIEYFGDVLSVARLSIKEFGNPHELDDANLKKIALELETRHKRWTAVVEEQCREFTIHSPDDAGGSRSNEVPKTIPLTANWLDYLEFNKNNENALRLLNRLRSPKLGDTWYFVTMLPNAFLTWQDLIWTAVNKRGVRVKWIYHSVSAARENPSIFNQWKTLGADPKKACESLKAARKLLKEWATNSESGSEGSQRKGESKHTTGSYEFFESRIVHYYMGFLAVPAKRPDLEHQLTAPDGSFCMVQPYPMFPKDYESRCALYLESPDPALNIYYQSFTRFFSEGLKEGLLVPDPA